MDDDAIVPLVPFIRGKTYAEPCYGAGDLEDMLMEDHRAEAIKYVMAISCSGNFQFNLPTAKAVVEAIERGSYRRTAGTGNKNQFISGHIRDDPFLYTRA